MKIDIDKLIELNALASKHFHKKHTIILPPGEKINFNNALGIEYDTGAIFKRSNAYTRRI